ncbi:aspartate/glutamate racemase family protein [Bacteroidota bacterium]
MKTLGLIGGTGWVSTVDYYRLINQEVNKRMGGLNAGKILLHSFNYADINALNKKNNLDSVYEMVENAAQDIIGIGADGIVLCANTLHKFADRLQKEITKPIIHIAEAAAEKIKNKSMNKVGLLGTKYTMEWDFYKTRLSNKGITALVPETEDRQFIHDTIFNELLIEVFKKESKERILRIMDDLKSQGAEGIVLGCTELPLVIKANDTDLPIINTLEIHAKAAVDFALS